MDDNNLDKSFECVRDHAWLSYVSTIDESLPLKKVWGVGEKKKGRI